MKIHKLALLIISVLAVSMLTGCADHVSFAEAATRTPVGFWYGWWHGMILPFAWVCQLFDPDISIYAIYNNGGWYNFGFVLGCGAILGGSRYRSNHD